MSRLFSSGTTTTQEKIRSFLRSTSSLVRKYNGSARLLIYSTDMRVVYPNDEQERADAAAFSALCADYIRSSDFQTHANVQKLTGETDVYLVSVYQIPTHSQQIEYLAAYRDFTDWHMGGQCFQIVLGIFCCHAAGLTVLLARHAA